MKSTFLSIKPTAAILGFALLLGVFISAEATGQAQYGNRSGDQNRRGRDWDGYGRYGGSANLRQTALNAGFGEGVKAGEKARRSGDTDYRNLSVYVKATKDYSSRLGDRGIYSRYFREAFDHGYADGYGQSSNNRDNQFPNRGRDNGYPNRDRADDGNRSRRGRNWDGYGNLGGSFQLRQTALNAGFNEGLKQGRSDRKRNRNGFGDQSTYQRATKDYSSKLGDREVYQRYFRAAYENGYADGINGF